MTSISYSIRVNSGFIYTVSLIKVKYDFVPTCLKSHELERIWNGGMWSITNQIFHKLASVFLNASWAKHRSSNELSFLNGSSRGANGWIIYGSELGSQVYRIPGHWNFIFIWMNHWQKCIMRNDKNIYKDKFECVFKIEFLYLYSALRSYLIWNQQKEERKKLNIIAT